MANNIQVLINTGNPDNNKTVEVLQGGGKRGKPTTIKAVKGARYQLEEQTAKNTAPENIRSKRVGKNLHVMLNGSKDADLIIENYYDEEMLSDNNRGLYGRAEDGKIYEYIPEDPTREGMPINLADGGRPVSQVLGGLQVGEAFELSGLVLAAAGGGFGLLGAGAAVVGGAALAGGGGGGGGAGTDPAAAALASIKAAAEDNTATSGNLAASVFTAAGVTGVDASNLAAIQSALDSAAVNGNAADTKEEVQAIVDAYNAIKANADGTANNNATNPTQAQYAAIGVTGVDTATEESLLGDAIDGKPFSAVDTVAEVQTLANAASAVMTGAAGGTAPTKAQLEALGITGVTDANLSAIQAAIAATPDNGTGVDTLSELQAVANTGATNAANAAAALSAIAAAAQANDATDTNVAASVFATAGITGVDSSNVAAIQSALNSAAVVGTSADTKPEVQAIVDAYNAIKANADGTANNNATNPTQAQYAAIGVTGVDSNVKASLLGDVVDAKPFSAVDTVPELQALADAAAAVMTAAAGPTGGNAPTRAQLEALGITGVTDANLQYVQDSIARTADDGIGVDTLAELQAVVTIGIDAAAAAAAAAAAITTISAAAQANDASNTNVAASVFVTAGVTGVDSTNVAAIQSALNSANVNGAATDTLVEIQNIVNAYNAIRENADGTANNYATNPTQAEYALIGVTGVDTPTEVSLLGDAIDGKPFSAVDSVPEVQALADAAAAVMTGAAGGTAPTKAQLEALGITGVTDANLAAVLAAIAATPDNGTGVDTLSELQAVATAAAAAAAALDTIKAAAEGNTATSGNLAASVFTAAGVTGVTPDNLAAIQSALDSNAVNGAAADTKPEVQAIVDAYNAIKANADGIGNNNTTNPTQAQYAAIGVTGVSSAPQESLLGDAIDGKPFSAVDTVAEVQALANAAAAVMTGAAGGTAPTKAQLEALGITGVTDANLAAVLAAIAATPDNGTGVDTLSELQAITDAATATAASAAALDLIKNAAEGNTAGTTPSLADFVTAGITGVDSNNFAAINSALNSNAVNGLATDTKSEVQAIVDAYNVIKANADSASTANATYAQYTAVGVTGIDNTAKANLLGDVVDGKTFADVDTVPELQTLATAAAAVIAGATGGTAPTEAQLTALGITGVTPTNLAAVQAAIAATGNGGAGVDSLTELQAVATAAANAAAALSTIAAAAGADNASNTNVPYTLFATAGVTGVDANNVAAIQSALNDADVQSGQADTAAKVQAVVDAYNAIKANADTASTANATAAQYAAVGVNGIDNAAKTSLLGDVVDTKDFADVDTVGELQTLATAAAAVISGATTGGTAPTKAQLEALGITGVTDANLSAIQAAIANTADNGTDVDTLAELQAVANTGAANAANAAAALSTIAAAAGADNASNTNVPYTLFATAGVTGVDANNVAAIQSALNDSDVQSAQADTAAKVQAVVDAYNAIKANADAAGTTNATQAQYAAIGVNGIDSAAKTSLLGDVVDTKDFADVDTVGELQTLATAAAAVISGATTGGTAPTKAQLEALGITGVTTGNLAAVLAAIAATPDNGSGVDTLTKLQTLVSSINDAPTGTSSTITVAEDGSKTFAASDFGFADASDSPANALQAVIITTLPTAGTLKLGTTVVALNQSIAVADLGNLVFAPAANANGTGYATIGFKVQDNGGTTNGGADTSTTANTLTFNVTAVNDQPTAPTSTTATSTEDQGAPTSASFGQTIGSLASLSGSDVEGATVGLAFVAPITFANTYGKAWYSIDGGTTWLDLTDKLATASATNALILDASVRVYFQGNANQSGGLGSATFRTWDGTDSATSGAYKDISTLQGSAGAYSATTGSLNFGVSAVNDAPVNTVPVAQSTTTATAKVITGLQIEDVDAYTADMTITLAVDHGTISVATGTGVTFGTNGTSSVTLTGTKGNLNALLASANAVTYTSAAGYVGSDTLTMTTSDNGNTGSGGTLTDIDTVAITVASPDSIAPTLLASNPSDNGYIATVASDLTLTFSEAVKKGTGNIQLFKADGSSVEIFDAASSSLVTGWGTSTLTINPTASLLAGTGYYVKVANTAVTDLAGNAYAGIADATTFNFTVLNSDGSIPVVPPYGGTANSVLGWSVAGAGDVNGDGYDDVIVTAKNEDATYKGAAYVIYGNASGKGADLSGGTIASSLGFKISGGISDFLGSIVTGIGDVNGDGFADVLVATDKANSATTINAAYVVYGSATNANVDLANGTISSTVGYKVAGGTGNSNFANDVAGAGDFNGDGLADMIVSGHVDSGTGGAYVVYGKKTYSNLDLSAGTIASSDGIKITGGASDGMGWSVSGAGDVNGDGLSDVIIGAATNPSAYVVYGTTSAASIDLSSGTIASNVGFKLSNGGTYGGYAISSIGDVNGDGFADVAYGAYNGYGVSGNAFVVYGGNTVPSLNLNTAIAPSVGFKITGLSGIGPREFLSSAGDVNGDGLGDLIVSSYLEDKTYVVYGNTTGANIDLSGGTIASSAGFALKQPVSGQLGFSVSSAGDINGDGLADLILGAPTTNSSSGAYYYVLGGTSTITTVANLTGTSAGEAVLGTAGADTLTGGGGVDRFYAGAGNDTIVLQASDATNLSATTGATRALVSGGNGFDTIRLNGTNLDLTAVSNAGAMGLEENSRVESIEGIDMRTDTAANTLTIAAKDVADMADFNSIHLTTVSDDGKTWTNVGAGTALSATTKFHQVVVDGTSADTLNLAAGNGFWTNAGEVNNGTTGYYVYQNTAMNSQVIVDKTVVVNNPDNKAVAGDAVIDLGANGKLIAPVQVEGNWYYFWDRSGNGVADSADLAMHSDVDPIFNKDINGNVHTGATNDTYRYATLNGVKVALPRFGATYTGDLPLNPQYEQFNGTAATIGGTSIPYDDMMAIWDINNGTSTAKYQTGLPSGWSGASWWMTASMSSFGGNYVVTSNMESAAPTGDYQISAIALQVLPVVIDLNRDGILSYGQVTMDVNGDGHLDTTKWAGAQDGVLVWDKFADGLVHNNSQYAFGQYATTYRTDALGHARAATDLEGLADAFDTNHDGVFNAADAQFGEFKVWQDANQNGVSDAGEVRSLADLGISSINLTSDGVVRTPVDGVTEAGQTTATAIDGSSVLVSDAGFAYSALDYAVTGSAMNLLGANMHLDLSSVVAVHSDVAAVDLTGTGANTVKLNLADVLSVATDASIANGVHKLTLTGDANDTVELDLSQWANTGTTVTEGDHTYAVYNAAASAAAQLLIDQHMVLANHG